MNLVLNYRYRLTDTQEMPDWVSLLEIWNCGLRYNLFTVQLLFLQWIHWFLCMSCPGDEITRKSILMTQKMKEMDMKEISSKSLLANVLDSQDTSD